MAGHSAFKNIMHKKGRKDAARAKMFAKFAREITVAASRASPDPAMNARLRLAIQTARAENMPKDNIERAIKKATGGDTETYESIRYEGYAPGRRRRHRRGADRQSQPHRRRGACRLHQVRRQSRLDGVSGAHVLPRRRDQLRPGRGLRRQGSRGSDRRRRRRRRVGCQRPHRHLRLRQPGHGGSRPRGEPRRRRKRQGRVEADADHPRRRGERRLDREARSPRSRTTTTCRTSTPTSRSPTRSCASSRPPRP